MMSLRKIAEYIWPIPFCLAGVYLLFMTEGNEVILLMGLSGFVVYYVKVISGVRIKRKDEVCEDLAKREGAP